MKLPVTSEDIAVSDLQRVLEDSDFVEPATRALFTFLLTRGEAELERLSAVYPYECAAVTGWRRARNGDEFFRRIYR